MYRGQPTRYRARNGNHKQNPALRRLALTRVTARPKPTSKLGTYIGSAVAMVFAIVAFVVLAVVLAIATGLSFIAQMQSELPSVASFDQLDYAQPSVVYDRTGTVQLATFPGRVPQGRQLRRHPQGPARLDHRGRGPHLLGERGLRPAGNDRRLDRERDRNRPTRWVHDHAAAGARSPAAAGRGRGRPVPAQGQGDPAGQGADRGISRGRRQAAHHHRLPEPDLLRPPGLWRRGCRAGLLRRLRHQTPDAGPGSPAGRPAAGAGQLRPVQVGAAGSIRSARGAHPVGQRRGPAATGHSAQLHPDRAPGGLRALHQNHARAASAGAQRADHPPPAGTKPDEGSPVRLLHEGPARPDPGRPRPGRDAAATRSSRRST